MNINITILGQTIAFIIFVIFCMKYIWPPLISAIEKRQKEISDNLSFVENEKKKLIFAKKESDEYIKQIRIKAQKIIELAEYDKNKILNKAKEEAEMKYKYIVNIAKKEIEIARNQAYDDLQKNIANISLLCAKKALEQSIDESINTDIVNKIINKL